MKKARRYCVAFAAGAIGAILEMGIFDPFWFDLGGRKPVANWLVEAGYASLAGYWGLVWINLPEWVTALALGAVLGVVLRRSAWLSFALVASAGFVLVPHIAFILLEPYPWAYHSFSVAVQVLLWDLISIPLLLLAAWLSHRLLRRGLTPSSDRDVASPEIEQA